MSTVQTFEDENLMKPFLSSGLFASFRVKTSPELGSCAIDCKKDAACLSFQWIKNVCYLGGRLNNTDEALTSVFMANN